MSIQRPSGIGSEWCPDCGDEMSFSGVQPAGYAQFFCEQCRYRRDTFVGTDVDR
ncbi:MULTISPECIES: HVO_2142 family zinc finger protein [Halobellus]|uniref:HVO_2142 family zinc finger protein n=1 Tax=Halobellus TaxID=1073986 RepID=UPI002114B011|nr:MULTISPECIES: HVO_2142 family zinc finger protein [Halobellus]MDQ2055675.1 HVO_2142 family zinc finger protein [Halobellus sp. H-GB7]